MVEVQVDMEPMEVKLNGHIACHTVSYVCGSTQRRLRAGVMHPIEEFTSQNQGMIIGFSLWRKLQDDVHIALGQVLEIGPRSKERQ